MDNGYEANCVGNFGLGTRNDREILVQFCQKKGLIVANTFCKLPERRLYGLKAPGNSPNNIIRSQIDFILINKQYQNSFKATKTYPGTGVTSDHNPLVTKIQIKLKKTTIHKK